jgi:hypothetical protein
MINQEFSFPELFLTLPEKNPYEKDKLFAYDGVPSNEDDKLKQRKIKIQEYLNFKHI